MWFLSAGDRFGDRYRILRELGSGGMSYVFAAEDLELGESVALKVIKPDFLDDEDFVARFKREVRIARQIRHPNIIQVLEFGSALVKERRFYYLTMELLEGRDLSVWLRDGKELALADALRIGLQVCDALAEAHRAGVVHRDIKPQNIFIERDGRVKLMDFGISRLPTLPSVTTGGQLLGTPKYMSPEQVHRKTEPDHRSDVYSLGVVLYELVTRRTPFEGQSTVEIALKQVQQPPPKPSEFSPHVPPKLEKLILKCLEKEPSERYQSVAELRTELQAIPSASDVQTLAEQVTEILSMQPTETARSVGPTAAVPERPRAGTSSTASKATIRRKSRALSWKLAVLGFVLALAGVLIAVGLRGRGDTPILPEPIPPPEPEVAAASEPPPAVVSSEAPLETTPATTSVPQTTSTIPVAAEGRVVIESDPPGATLHVDGRAVGRTPWRGSLPPGPKRITLSSRDFVTAQDTIDVVAGETVSRSLRLSPIVRKALVRFSANPETQIYVDGELLGTIPPVIERELAAGAHDLRYVMPGYAEHAETVEVHPREGQEFSHQFPVPGSLRVNAQPYARVFLDGKDLGFTPVRVEKVSEGEHRIVLERDGFERIEQTIAIQPFEINRFQFKMVREP